VPRGDPARPVKFNKLTVDQSALFDGLKQDIALRPKKVRRLRLSVASQEAKFSESFGPDVCEIGDASVEMIATR
jgi:hypothetical protein